MNKNSSAFEQYCSIVGKNVIIEEVFLKEKDKKEFNCMNIKNCEEHGGCKNRLFFGKQR